MNEIIPIIFASKTAADRAAVAIDKTTIENYRADAASSATQAAADRAQTALDAAATAIDRIDVTTSKLAVDASAISAALAASASQSSKNAAETAAGLAGSALGVYPDTTAALAAVAEGAYFLIAGTGTIYASRYRKVGGLATLKVDYPSKAALDAVAVAAIDNGDLITGSSHVFADRWGGVIAEIANYGRDLVLPLGSLRFEDSKLSILTTEASPDASTPSISRLSDGKVRLGLTSLALTLDPVAGTINIPGHTSTADTSFIANADGSTSISNAGGGTIKLGSVAGSGAVGALTVAADMVSGLSLMDAYGGVFAEFATDATATVGGFAFNWAAGTLKAPDGTVVHPSPNSISYDIPTGITIVGSLKAAPFTGGDAFVDQYGGVVAEFGTDGISSVSNFAFDANASTITAPDGSIVFQPATGGATYVEPRPLPTSYPDLPADADADAIIAAHVITPSIFRRRMIRGLVAEMKAAGLWAKTDVLYLDDANDIQAASINFRSPTSYVKTVSGTAGTAWKSDRGATGDGASYIQDTNWSPLLNGVNFTQNNCCIAVENATYPADTAYDVGVGDTLRMNLRNTSDQMAINANSTTQTTALACTNAVGTFFFGRSDAANQLCAIDSGSATSAAATSSAIPAGTLKIMGGISGTYSASRIKKVWAGAWLNDNERAALATIFSKWSGDVGSRWAPLTAGPPVLSRDLATYGSMSSQQIISHERFGNRQIRVNYGINNQPLGTNGEVIPCYVRVSISDDGGATVTPAIVFLPRNSNEGLLDPHICRLNDGRALIVLPYLGKVAGGSISGSKRSIWGVIINNPQGDPAAWDITEPFFLDYGFVGRPRYVHDNLDLRYTASDPVGGIAPPYSPDTGNRYCSLTPGEKAYRSDRLSHIPVSVSDGSNNNFFETSIVDIGSGGVRAIFRALDGIWTCTSVDEVNWTTPVKMTWMDGHAVPSRVDATRSPSGRFILAAHGATTGRNKATLYVSDINGDGTSFPHKYTYDENYISYFSLTFGRNSSGAYNGEIEVAYDHGRGLGDIPAYTNELVTATINEDALIAGSPRAYLNHVYN